MTDQLLDIDLSTYSTGIISLDGQARLLALGNKTGLDKSPWKELSAAFNGHHTCRFKFSNGMAEGFVSNMQSLTGHTEFELTIAAKP